VVDGSFSRKSSIDRGLGDWATSHEAKGYKSARKIAGLQSDLAFIFSFAP
jgi:hypothetical protein